MWTRLLLALTGLIAVMAALIFVPAGTVNYWQAWLFLACYLDASVIVAAWLVRNDRALLERRMRGGPFAEGERSQKIIMTITSIGFVALLVVPGLDRRFGWSQMPGAIAGGSWWGVLVLAAMLPALAWRLVGEERLLVRDLDAQYRRKVRWRLLPFVW